MSGLRFGLCTALHGRNDDSRLRSFYVDGASGSNSNDGRSPDSAWQTLAKVNGETFQPGDRVLFAGGQTFTGQLAIGANMPGRASKPIIVGSYGTGKATITRSSGTVVEIANQGGLIIQDLIVTSTGTSWAGLLAYNDLVGNVRKERLVLRRIEATGSTTAGIMVGGNNNASGWAGLLIENCQSHDLAGSGIETYGNNGERAISDVVVRGCTAYNCGRDGILVGGADGALVEYCLAYNCGTAADARVGIWFYETDSGTIRFCESHSNISTGSGDGGGFDIDGDCHDCTIEYCYSHDNFGAGFMVYAYSGSGGITNATVRYCISENDGVNGFQYGGLSIGTENAGTDPVDAVFHNNTVYQAVNGRGAVSLVTPNDVTAKFYNNIFYAAVEEFAYLIAAYDDGGSVVGWEMKGNLYYAPVGVQIYWGTTTYTSLASWQAATSQELHEASSVYVSGNPLLTNAGSGGTTGGYDADMSAYRLQEGSPAFNAGLDLNAEFTIDIGPQDFFGNAVAPGSRDIGAYSG